MVAIINRVI